MISVVQVETDFPVRKLSRTLEKTFRMRVSFPRQVVHATRASLNLVRNQWDAEGVIEGLEKKFGEVVLGIFPHDLYVGAMNFVFGAAHLGGKAGVMSTFRLKPPAARNRGEKRIVEDIFFKRVEKEAVHELGHVFGLDHCKNEHCVMSFSPSLYWVDFKGRELCSSCSMELGELLQERSD